MKLCKDCRWCERFETFGLYAKCVHPSVASPVDGSGTRFCVLRRERLFSRCGKAGRQWEPRVAEVPA